MNEPTMETLAQRLDRVERANRRLKLVGVVALAVIAGGPIGLCTDGYGEEPRVVRRSEATNHIFRFIGPGWDLIWDY